MTNEQALNLHNEDEVTVKTTKSITTVIDSYLDNNNHVIIETDYDGFTKFSPDQLE